MGAGRGSGRANCVCYWGCGNIGNQIVWAAVAISAALGIGLIIGGAVDGNDCFKKYNDCRDNGVSANTCQNYYNSYCNLSKWQGILGSGIIILFFITPLLTCYFCCCAVRPQQPGGSDTAMVVVSSTVPPPGYYPPQGYPYPPPPQGGYPQAPPGAYPQYPPQQYPPMPPGAYPQYPPQQAPGAGPSQPTQVVGVPYAPPPPGKEL